MRKPLFTAQELCLTALFTALTVVLAQVSIPLPFTPVPITLGLVAVYLAGIFLSPKCALTALVLYLVMGAIGLPVFAGFQGGPGRLLGPTGGCLFAYPITSGIIAFALNRPAGIKDIRGDAKATRRTYIKAFASIFTGILIVYVFTTIWLCFTMGISLAESLAIGVLPFVVIDVAKIVVTVLIFLPVRKQLHKAGLVLPLPKEAK